MNDTHEGIIAPARRPEPGFYYHYKHDSAGPENGYAYEVMGVGQDTEDSANFMVIYRPLYDWAPAYAHGKMSYLRPLEMFTEEVNKPEYKGPRFNKIEDVETIERLKGYQKEMYG